MSKSKDYIKSLDAEIPNAISSAPILNSIRSLKTLNRYEMSSLEDIKALMLSNIFLWELESFSRMRTSTLKKGYIKRSIDVFNKERNCAIDKLNIQFESVEPSYIRDRTSYHSKACLNSESPGQILDRLCILRIKAHYSVALKQRTELLKNISELEECLMKLEERFANGHKSFIHTRANKLYNKNSTNRSRTADSVSAS